MNGQHSSKSLSFLMELIIVLLFFTIASAIAVFVISGAKEKNDYAMDARKAIFYGENLIEEQSDFLQHDQFYLDQDGEASLKKEKYKVVIKRDEIAGITQQKCTLKMQRGSVHLVTLTYLYDGGSTS